MLWEECLEGRSLGKTMVSCFCTAALLIYLFKAVDSSKIYLRAVGERERERGMLSLAQKGVLSGTNFWWWVCFFLFFFSTTHDSYLVDPASSHMLVSKIKPCMSKYKQFIQ